MHSCKLEGGLQAPEEGALSGLKGVFSQAFKWLLKREGALNLWALKQLVLGARAEVAKAKIADKLVGSWERRIEVQEAVGRAFDVLEIAGVVDGKEVKF